MKCKICNKRINIENIIDFITLQLICKECVELFQYSKISVRISNVKIIAYRLTFYNKIREFHSNLCYYYIDYYLDYALKNKRYYFLKQLTKEVLEVIRIRDDRIIILYYQSEYDILLKIISFLCVERKIKKIITVELIK